MRDLQAFATGLNPTRSIGWIDHSRVPLRLSFKASLSAKILWQSVLISTSMKTDLRNKDFARRLALK